MTITGVLGTFMAAKRQGLITKVKPVMDDLVTFLTLLGKPSTGCRSCEGSK
ncbi:MAG: DUF3368 domain-containing protein [Coleofasciculaceae cyanobacterium]